ncbi:MAG: preprotein translocase subunit SecY [Bacilli bacterium]|nr:preprotein translocase subunit SecY [Bacilli bacterium]MDD4282529.1 preprotein translocase subunit SecY [Bacilli bacterium]MDD4718290.1 preprotein translocase subunit SecY [Bacilli bacterium]
MFAKFKQIFNPKNKDIQKKIIFTFFALFIFKLGTTIVVPGVDQSQLGTNSLGFLELMNVMGGGALAQFSIFGLGVMPYITASIIIQLAQMDIVPYLSDLAKEGHTGRIKINQITRVLGIVLAFIQGYIMSFAFIKTGTVLEYMQFATVLTAGTAFLLWMGDQITAKGIGNGISLIIMTGIIASLPSMFVSAWENFTVDGSVLGILIFILFVIIYLLIVIGVIFEQTAERRIPIQYANKSTSVLGKQTYIPFKLNSAGVIPVIFASSLLSIPAFFVGMFDNPAYEEFIKKYVAMDTPIGFVVYIMLIIAFSYFYTFLQLKPKEMAENLQKNGGYIPGTRPGEETIKFINGTLYKLTLVGALSLAVIAGLPIIFSIVSKLPANISIGGTGLLIVVGVALETYKGLESQLTSRTYTKRRGRRK